MSHHTRRDDLSRWDICAHLLKINSIWMCCRLCDLELIRKLTEGRFNPHIWIWISFPFHFGAKAGKTVPFRSRLTTYHEEEEKTEKNSRTRDFFAAPQLELKRRGKKKARNVWSEKRMIMMEIAGLRSLPSSISSANRFIETELKC